MKNFENILSDIQEQHQEVRDEKRNSEPLIEEQYLEVLSIAREDITHPVIAHAWNNWFSDKQRFEFQFLLNIH